MSKTNLISKYNIPVPRYTSYPTVPNWNDKLDDNQSIELFKKALVDFSEDGISVYIHLPYCESLCTYCGCNKSITKSHDVEEKYVKAIQEEWSRYVGLIPKGTKIAQLHLGGGTPTFFSADNLERILKPIIDALDFTDNADISFEGHPSNTTYEQLKRLRGIGFNRVSYGVQDLDVNVQTAINRIQPFEEVKTVVDSARELGYSSINLDLIYGLPFQTIESVENTIHKIASLKPNRIANYAYAHVPWKSKSQRLYSDNDIPKGEEKQLLYQKGKELLENYGYHTIGMDHFAQETDELYICYQNKEMNRNFMGYTTLKSKILIGLGVSAISDFYYGYKQNEKTISGYYKSLETPTLYKGKVLNDKDVVNRAYISNIMCNGYTSFSYESLDTETKEQLQELAEDGLISFTDTQLNLTPIGAKYVRNISSAFDTYYSKNPTTKTFSSSI